MLKLIPFISIFIMSFANLANSQFLQEENLIIDLRNNIEWYRCSVGQTWDPKNTVCNGEPVKFSQSDVQIALTQAKDQLGGKWRLPTLDELESIICEDCEPPKVIQKYFSNVSREAYWTGSKNRWNSKMYWSVNFQTGYTYSRFFGYQTLPILIVRGR